MRRKKRDRKYCTSIQIYIIVVICIMHTILLVVKCMENIDKIYDTYNFIKRNKNTK